ncbi:hypothetical protein ACFLTW_05060 [Chloroflexota bacterium]
MKNKSKMLLLALTIVSIITAIFAAGVVSADEPETTATPAPVCSEYGVRFGPRAAFGLGAVTDLVGLTPEEVAAERQAGKSLVDIAADNGVGEDELVAAVMAVKTEAVQAKVEAGVITQDQADLILARMQERTVEAVNRTEVGPFGRQFGKATENGNNFHRGPGGAMNNGAPGRGGAGGGMFGARNGAGTGNCWR